MTSKIVTKQPESTNSEIRHALNNLEAQLNNLKKTRTNKQSTKNDSVSDKVMENLTNPKEKITDPVETFVKPNSVGIPIVETSVKPNAVETSVKTTLDEIPIVETSAEINKLTNNIQMIETQNLRNFIFDPLSTIIKLAILSKKPDGSKIYIGQNMVAIQEAGIFQGLVRYYQSNAKNDLHFLAIPIFFACDKYLHYSMLYKIPEIEVLFTSAQNGLLKLMKTYSKYPLIIHCLQYYKTIIQTYIENTDTPIVGENMFNDFKEILEDSNNLSKIGSSIDKTLLNFYTTELFKKIDTIWSDNKIKIVIDMVKYLINESSSFNCAKSIETFMTPIDNEISSHFNPKLI